MTENLAYLSFMLIVLASVCLIVHLMIHLKWLTKCALALSAISAAALTVGLASRWLTSGRPPLSNMYEFTLFFVWAIVIFALIMMISRQLYGPCAFTLPIAAMLLGYSFFLSSEIRPLMPALRSNWLFTHVLTSILSYGAFALACGIGIYYLLKLPTKIEDFSTEDHQLGKNLEQSMYNTVVVGFIFLSLLIITGAVWAEEAWGHWWSWDPKETWALITWLIYAAYLHLHRKPAWRGHKGCYLAIIGFICVLFTFLGVSFFLPGLHSYA